MHARTGWKFAVFSSDQEKSIFAGTTFGERHITTYFKFVTSEKNRATFYHLKKSWKILLFYIVNTLYPCLQTKLNNLGWPKIAFGNLREDISGQYFWDKGYTLKLLVHITFMPASPANTTILRSSTLQ